ncbi:MAG: tRNA lysidine(34) synthetase TilS [Syntrophales bacterium]|jgi:tRNA(Ile)-lysidine synthase|nr:tRNA lysidine(34) synthetase TilS [Syntrophales bacterium]
MNDFLIKIKNTIDKYKMIVRGDRIGVALSGGADSISLFWVLLELAAHYEASLMILHVNHGLRGIESDKDERFVKELGEKLNIAVQSRSIPLSERLKEKGGSIEDTARDMRYEYFEEAKNYWNLTKIALGHTLNDQAETVFMKILRGSGLSGMRGILPVRGEIYIRPLIETKKEEIISFLSTYDLAYVNDLSNLDDCFLRNRVRSKLIPELIESFNPRLLRNIGQMTDIMREDEDFISKMMMHTLSRWRIDMNRRPVALDLAEFNKCHMAVKRRILRFLIENISEEKRELGYRHIQSIFNIINGKKPHGMVDIGQGTIVQREYDRLLINNIRENASRRSNSPYSAYKECNFMYPVTIPSLIHIEEISRSIIVSFVELRAVDYTLKDTAFMDYNKIEFPLKVRNFIPGDSIAPLGLGGTKKIKSLFIDNKIPRRHRGCMPLLEDRESILWVAGICLSDKVKITEETKKILKAQII